MWWYWSTAPWRATSCPPNSVPPLSHEGPKTRNLQMTWPVVSWGFPAVPLLELTSQACWVSHLWTSPDPYLGTFLCYVHSCGVRNYSRHVYVWRGATWQGLVRSTGRGDFGTQRAAQTDRQTDRSMISLTPGNSLTAKHGPERPGNLIHQISAPGDEELLSLLKASPLTTHILLIRKWGCLDIWGSWPLTVEMLWL